jgi:hypothetical protein
MGDRHMINRKNCILRNGAINNARMPKSYKNIVNKTVYRGQGKSGVGKCLYRFYIGVFGEEEGA